MSAPLEGDRPVNPQDREGPDNEPDDARESAAEETSDTYTREDGGSNAEPSGS